ncbi:MAG: M48 family metallopeptidase [Candidatus Hodarchaeales archaeon]|jgi:Zn-dependent protease with chaperone function
MSDKAEAQKFIDPPPRHALRAKWLNLLMFFILDLVQILIISSIRITESDTSIIFFVIYFDVNLYLTFGFLIIIYFLRSLMSTYSTLKLFKKSGIFQLYPHENNDKNLPLEIQSANKITEWVLEISNAMKIGKITKIFLAKTAIPNAYTIQLSPLPIIPIFKKRYVVLNSNITKILNEKEIQAVIAHELGHIKNRDSFIRVILSGPHIFLQIAYLLLYLFILTGISNALYDFNPIAAAVRTLVLFIVMILATLISDWAIGFLRKSNQMAELQADLKAVRQAGYKPTINMLIKLGQRTEVLETLKLESVWLEKQDLFREDFRRSLIFEILEKFPETEIDEQKAFKHLPKVYLEKQIEILRENYFLDLHDLPGLEEKISSAATQLYEKRREQLEKASKRREQIVDWRSFDLDRDLSLETEEIIQFIKHLRTTPRMLFQNEYLETHSQERSHPSFRIRILFISNYAIKKNLLQQF